MANLILWRHAEAEEQSHTGKDTDRALTRRGQKDAQKMAKWLAQHLPDHAELWCSPARRCLETASSLEKLSGIKVNVLECLSIHNSVERIAKEVVNDDISRTIVVVGHQPNLCLLVSKLLGMNPDACVVKKGAVWWLRQRLSDDGKTLQTYLFAVRHPSH